MSPFQSDAGAARLTVAEPPLEGFDPYDALRGTRVPGVVRRHARLRQAVLQLRKRGFVSPDVLGVTPFVMAKTLGSHLTAVSRLHRAGDPAAEIFIRELAGQLLNDPSIARIGGGAWGYEFDVQTRWAYYPQGEPNSIVTYFVGRAFLDAHVATGFAEYLEQARQSARFLLDAMCADGGFFRYTLGSSELVHNANLLAAAFVGAAGWMANEPAWRDQAFAAAEMSTSAQRDDGSWTYGTARGLAWVDNFHTAYVLDALLMLHTCGMGGADAALERGASFWASNFFEDDGAPRYYAARALPYDIHSAATAVDVGYRLADSTGPVSWNPATTAAWTRAHLVGEDDAATYYQMTSGRRDERRFARWGDAHWFCARASERLHAVGLADATLSAIARKAAQ